MGRSIIITAYDPDWEAHFKSEAERLHQVFGATALSIHHIGSTAIPGMWAKPVIDILVEVDEISVFDALSPGLNTLGYRARGENGIPERRYFTKGGDMRTHHVHAYPRGSDHILRHLCVRDFLLAHPMAAADYAQVKRDCASRHGDDPAGYANAKDRYVQALEQQALRWNIDRL